MINTIHAKEGWMKHPFWIANGILFFLVMFVFGFIYFFRAPIQPREEIEPEVRSGIRIKQDEQVDIQKIYENDLFGTYSKEIVPSSVHEQIQLLPPPPLPKKIQVPEIPAPQFLDPLDITLKGIIVVNTDSAQNRAVIQENKTKQESIYKIGGVIEDARLIRILNNKVIILRTNGQQEVLYLREQDAQADPAYMVIDGWEKVVHPADNGGYVINGHEFTSRITNLGQIIDMLGLTTAYKQGVSIGLAIGQMDKNALGPQLGLQSGDIITKVNGTTPIDVESRLNIYKQIIDMKQDDVIHVTIVRDGQEYENTYTIKEFDTVRSTSPELANESEHLKQEQAQTNAVESFGKRHDLAPTVQEIRRQERRNMLRKGKENQPPSAIMSAQ